MTWIHVSRRVANKLHLEQLTGAVIENLNLSICIAIAGSWLIIVRRFNYSIINFF